MSAPEEIESLKPNFLKRVETEKAIGAEHNRLKTKLEALKISSNEGLRKAEILKDEGIILSHRSASMSAEINQLKLKTEVIQKGIEDLEKELDKIQAKNNQVEIVKEKEEKSFELYHSEISERETILNAFWKKVLNEDGLADKKDIKEKLTEEKTLIKQKLEDRRQDLQTNTAKLNQEIIILKKRNAAHLKRMGRKVAELEEKIRERQEYLAQLRKNK